VHTQSRLAAQVLAEPAQARIRQFLHRILDPI
jgi:hypothetical protein